MERTYRFAIDSIDDEFDERALRNEFENIEHISVDYQVAKYYHCVTAKIVSKKYRYFDMYGEIEKLTDYELELSDGKTDYVTRYEDDEEFEVGETVEYGVNCGRQNIARIGSNLSKIMNTYEWSGFVITAPFDAIMKFLSARTGNWLTIKDTTNEQLKNYFDFEIGSCSSIEY